MKILHLLNVADLFFMAVGVAVAILMIVMGGAEERRKSERLSAPEPKPHVAGRRGVRR
jgi:hypothetical protein